MFATFLKNVGEKILTTVQKIINKEKVKACEIFGLNLLSGLFLSLVAFIIRLYLRSGS
jgi:hypothetical protein